MVEVDYKRLVLQKLRESKWLRAGQWKPECRITSPFIPSFYIGDLVSVPFGIVIEIDGYHHNTRQQRHKDAKRTFHLNQSEWWVVRVKIDNTGANLTDLIVDIGRILGLQSRGITPYQYHKEIIASFDAVRTKEKLDVVGIGGYTGR